MFFRILNQARDEASKTYMKGMLDMMFDKDKKDEKVKFRKTWEQEQDKKAKLEQMMAEAKRKMEEKKGTSVEVLNLGKGEVVKGVGVVDGKEVVKKEEKKDAKGKKAEKAEKGEKGEKADQKQAAGKVEGTATGATATPAPAPKPKSVEARKSVEAAKPAIRGKSFPKAAEKEPAK